MSLLGEKSNQAIADLLVKEMIATNPWLTKDKLDSMSDLELCQIRAQARQLNLYCTNLLKIKQEAT